MSPNSALLLNRLINGYIVLCVINGIIGVNMGEKRGAGGLASAQFPIYFQTHSIFSQNLIKILYSLYIICLNH
jgi:hypothetical protein